MATQTVTVELPDLLYRELQRRAEQSRQTIEQELLARVVQSLVLLRWHGQSEEEHLRRVGSSLDLEEVSDEEAARLVAEGWRRA